MPHTDRTLAREWPWLAGTAALYLLLALLAILLIRQPGNVASAWAASALIFGMVLRRGHAGAYIALGAAMRALAGWLVDDPWPIIAAHAAAGPVAIWIALGLLRRLRIQPTGLPDLPALIWPLLAIGVAGPGVGGLIPAAVHALQGTGEFLRVWATWIVATSFGALLVLPLLLCAGGESARRLRREIGARRFLLVLGGTLAVTAAAVGYLDHPFIVLSLPLLAASFALGRFGSSLVSAANLLLMIVLRQVFDAATLVGAQGDAVRSELLDSVAFNFYAALAAAPAQVVAVVQSQRRIALAGLQAGRRALYEEKRLAETMLSSIGDAVVAVDPQERITFMNPVAEALTGWPRDEALSKPQTEVLRLVDGRGTPLGLSPLTLALRERRTITEVADAHLLTRDGRRVAVDDSAAPIVDADGVVLGGVTVFRDTSVLRAQSTRMSHLAQHDYLTDLPNRVLLADRLGQALAGVPHGRRGALMFLDLDRFKAVNDTLGHEAGDLLLQAVAQRLRAGVRDEDTVSRQGGDEFVILLPHLDGTRDAAALADSLIAAVSRPYRIAGRTVDTGSSIGIALFPQDGDDAATLMQRADAALYRAKAGGRGRHAFHADGPGESADRTERAGPR